MSQDTGNQLIDLANLVKQMRNLQKEFFKMSKTTVSQYERANLVHRSKKLESEVDAAVEKVLHPQVDQPQLF